MRFVRRHNHHHTRLPLSKVNCQALFKLSTCPLRPPACTAAPPLTPWEQRTATSTYPSTAVRSSLCTHNPLPVFMPCDKNVLVFLPSPRQSLWHTAGCAADLVYVPAVAGFAGARSVAPSHRAGWEVEEGERRQG